MRDQFSDRTSDEFQQEMLTAINGHRARHGAPPLSLDPELVEYAKSRAAFMAERDDLTHDGLKAGYGENGSWQATSYGPTAAPATGATEAWYGEIKDYNFADPEAPNPKPIGHFTASVWKSTTKVGFGRVSGQGSKWWETYIVANFSPAGNMKGQYQANVSPTQS